MSALYCDDKASCGNAFVNTALFISYDKYLNDYDCLHLLKVPVSFPHDF